MNILQRITHRIGKGDCVYRRFSCKPIFVTLAASRKGVRPVKSAPRMFDTSEPPQKSASNPILTSSSMLQLPRSSNLVRIFWYSTSTRTLGVMA